ncbi:MAG: Hsp70 family protein [Myxococcota bacterium]|jgi:molecular chaperone DnaK|nr:Hsp70 family protein [Myxococcota bacterium]
MSEIVVGIDLGTSNSVISVMLEGQPIVIPDAEGNRIHPSIVYFFEDGRTALANAARTYRIQDPMHTVYSAKRLIGRPYESPELKVLIGSFPYAIVPSQDGAPRIQIRQTLHPPEGIGARILFYLKELAQNYLGQEVRKAVITVPANFDEGQRRATKRAGEMAGLEVLRLINEPTAAALAYGHGQGRHEKVAIYDFGGGTFDITILELRDNVFEVLATAGNSYLGGDDLDNRLVSSMLTAFEKQYGYDLSGDEIIRQRLKAIAQDIKHGLTRQDSVTTRVTEYVPGSLTELELEFSLSRDAFNRRTIDIVDQSLRTCEEAMRVANLQPSQIDHLVLVGGSTRVPIVAERTQQFFNKRAVAGINPDEVVSIGAAIFGASLVQPAATPPSPGGIDFARASGGDDAWMGGLDGGGQGGAQQRPMGGGGAMPPPQPAAAGPLLIDVTPHALGVATVGGVMDIIIERNGQLPLERTRYFSTSRDDQTRVVLPVYAGNSRRIEDNHQLGILELNDIPPGPREEVQIEVTFEVNTNSMLNVRATDMRTGRAQVAHLSVAGESTDLSGYDASDLLMG